MTSRSRLANEAWEAYFRTQATLVREFAEADIWRGLQSTEYAVMLALAGEPEGLRITQLGEDVLITQAGMSRLILRLEKRGIVQRVADTADGRAQRVRLTSSGLALQRQVGRDVARRITTVMTRALDDTQLVALRDLSLTMLAHAPGPAAEVQQRILAKGRR
ncbi:MarR family winged helix-turn-helix transcriptional regulator [Microbacterium sp. MAHUQ-60]|uniref:MarR family winged helix-turn-helix transcriptional regulator n=1 Tax=unclassified Microbacterium TaxID=2609290 RepID=UPI003619EDC2